MEDYLEISKQNVRSGQIIASAVALIFSTFLLIDIIAYFSFTLLIIFSFSAGCFYLILFNRSRDIYYKNGKVYLNNLFYKEEYDIAMFEGVYSTAFLGYSIKFKDGKEYYFRLLFEDIKLLFKSDSDFYTKKLNSQLLDKMSFHQSRKIL